ncbi:UNC-like C-terminal domain-containing protein [Trichoderma austrokoningii]
MKFLSCAWHGGFIFALLSSSPAWADDQSRQAEKASAPTTPGQCEVRTINYITHTLPSLCFKSSWTGSLPTPTKFPATGDSYNTTQHATRPPGEEQAPPSATEQTDTFTGTSAGDTFATPFMSFEDWKKMMLEQTGQDPQNLHLRNSSGRQKADRPSPDLDDVGLGEEGEISLVFDDYGEGEGPKPGPPTDLANANSGDDVDDTLVTKDGKAPIHRSKDAGKTCKERFSYSSFDAGATILKAGPQAKNAKAILVENKDSYMLLECAAQNKYVIVELSDDILIDTIVIANFEFFSSMVRHFRVSVSDRYPVKMDKWRTLGIFEAANSRDIQAFLVENPENPQIWGKYVRLEFLTHYGNEYYCPVSLLRVHGSTMLDSWRDSEIGREDESHEEDEEDVPVPTVATQPATAGPSPQAEDKNATLPELASTCLPRVDEAPFHQMTATCAASSTAVSDAKPRGDPSPGQNREAAGQPTKDGVVESDSASQDSPKSDATQARDASSTPTIKQTDPSKPTTDNAQTSTEPSDATGSSPGSSTKSRTTTASSATPTVQGSFYNSITKRLQQVESNLTLSLKYVEDQSRIMQDAIRRTEQQQVTKLTRFLGDLNHTVLVEMRSVREQYEQIWQSTVLALESQREQSERDIVALSTRLNLLADEVVFQKRMAIVQAILLLSCLFLVIFSRGVPIPYLAALQEQAGAIAYPSASPYAAGQGPHNIYKSDAGVPPDDAQALPNNVPVVSVSSFEAAPNVPSKRIPHSVSETTEPHEPICEDGEEEYPRRNSLPSPPVEDKYQYVHYLDQEQRFHSLHHSTPTHLNTPRKPLPSLPEHLASSQDS